jgi:hypothetical protein
VLPNPPRWLWLGVALLASGVAVPGDVVVVPGVVVAVGADPRKNGLLKNQR